MQVAMTVNAQAARVTRGVADYVNTQCFPLFTSNAGTRPASVSELEPSRSIPTPGSHYCGSTQGSCLGRDGLQQGSQRQIEYASSNWQH